MITAPVTFASHVVRPVATIVVGGLVAAAFAGAIGWGLERRRLGEDDAAGVARIQAELTARFDESAQTLSAHAQRVAAARDAIRGARSADEVETRRLFQLVEDELPDGAVGTGGVTVYSPAGTPLAWSGRVSDLSADRLEGPRALFVALDTLGPRLVFVEPVADPERPAGGRLATVAVEQRIDAGADVSPALTDTFLLPTSVVDVAVRARPVLTGARSPYAFEVQSREGQVLVEAEVSPASLAAARGIWRSWIRSAVFGLVALTLLLAVAPLLRWRRFVHGRAAVVTASLAVAVLLLAARAAVWVATPAASRASMASPLVLLPNALLAAGLVWLALDLMEAWRVAVPRRRLRPLDRGTFVRASFLAAAGGFAATAILWGYQRVLGEIAAESSLDLMHFSLHPLNVDRLAVACGLVLLHPAVIWAAAGLVRVPAIAFRLPHGLSPMLVRVAATLAGGAVMLLFISRNAPAELSASLLTTVLAAPLFAAALSRPRGTLRRASQAGRLGLLFLAVVSPAIALYPSLHRFATASNERTIAMDFAPRVASRRAELQQQRLPHALEAIDRMTGLADFVRGPSDAEPTTDRAFIVWSRTELATYRTTSAVELYGANGRLVSRFALVLPEYGTTSDRANRCNDWDVYEEASPFGSSLRPVLRASRAICENRRVVGAIVVRAMLDYRTLSFSSAEGPYLESLTGGSRESAEGRAGRDVEFAAYGWSRAPIYAPGTSVWPLSDAVFDRMVASRDPLWTEVPLGERRFRVYFFNDNIGIYALGYPTTTPLGHLINLGELVFLSSSVFLILMAAATLCNSLFGLTATTGRALLREIRSSFYRKLFIAFVAAAVVPVVVLALATRTYLATQLRAGVEETAVKTAAIAQRLIEDYAALQPRGTNSLQAVDDQFMALVGRATDQDVNLFDGPRLRATSERDLFASRLLPSRTPSAVYRSIVLDRLPTSVGVEEIGGVPYLLAAAPIRTTGHQGVVTVRQTLRGEDTERQRDELDRRVLSVSVLFVLLGAALGYWMAERIADPVNRLSRATRRIARGDLDARISTTASDELRRLVEDFNQMADDLKRRRAEVERTQRLEAWASMARQVAHDIKNPLTPIQLSAEHVQRVNTDRGRPLSPVVDECVAAILSQVKLLRQIAAEFSSFASSPTPRPEPTAVGELVDEVVAPYRAGLQSVSIDVRTDTNLPRVLVDKTLFARALTNIIENALHAMPGGGRLSIVSQLGDSDSSQARRVRVEIVDTGVGMDPEALGRIFEPYFSTKAAGTGLGLTIAKRNVDLVGGTIDVTSTRGIGTTVTLHLPASP